jgi:ribosomal protein S18 acetylase RimI-like enzyme
MIIIRQYCDNDLSHVARIHAEAFPRQGRSEEWVQCNARAYPRMRYYVSESNGEITGYILWVEKSGFRAQVVLELEQIAVKAEFQSQGIGAALIETSLNEASSNIVSRGAILGTVLVTTRSDNQAQRLYRKVLGAEVAAIVLSLFSGDEVLMIARDPLRSKPAVQGTLRDKAAQHLLP